MSRVQSVQRVFRGQPDSGSGQPKALMHAKISEPLGLSHLFLGHQLLVAYSSIAV